jgi:hypothetical protein
MPSLTVAVGLEEGREVGVDVVGMDAYGRTGELVGFLAG